MLETMGDLHQSGVDLDVLGQAETLKITRSRLAWFSTADVELQVAVV